MKVRGAASSSSTRHPSSLSISMCISREQCAHSVLMTTDRFSPRNRPCTKGTAKVSIPQAEYASSPVLKVT
jgi:hypothetical protein